MSVVHLYTTSTGLDLTRLRAGTDLILHLHLVHGADAPHGAYVLDHFDAAERRAADAAALGALYGWRAGLDEAATVEGVCWPYIWMLPLYRLTCGVVARGLALRKALRQSGARTILLMDTGEEAERLARCVAADLGIAVRRTPGAAEPGPLLPPLPPPTRAQRARKGVAGAVVSLGTPSVVRDQSVAVHAY